MEPTNDHMNMLKSDNNQQNVTNFLIKQDSAKIIKNIKEQIHKSYLVSSEM